MVLALAEALARDPGSGRLWRPVYDGRRGHPILFHHALAPAFQALAPAASPRPMLRELPAEAVLDVAVDEPGILQDIDRPEDLRAVRAVLAGRA